jgi:hypothetical protein
MCLLTYSRTFVRFVSFHSRIGRAGLGTLVHCSLTFAKGGVVSTRTSCFKYSFSPQVYSLIFSIFQEIRFCVVNFLAGALRLVAVLSMHEGALSMFLQVSWFIRSFIWRRHRAYSLRLGSSKCCGKRWKYMTWCDSKLVIACSMYPVKRFCHSYLITLAQQYLHEFQRGPPGQKGRMHGVLRRWKWVHQALDCVSPWIVTS